MRTSEKLASMKQHLHFNIRARRYNIIPKSLKVKPLVNNQEGRDIAERMSKKCLQVRISQNIRTIRSLEHDITYQRNEILYMLDKQYVSVVENLREKAYRDRSNK